MFKMDGLLKSIRVAEGPVGLGVLVSAGFLPNVRGLRLYPQHHGK